jgi:hypothetical protein
MGNEVLYSWSFSNDKNRWSLWYIIALSVVIWLVVWGFLSRQYPLSFLIILITGVYFFVENNSEDIINISLTQLWIKLNNSFYDYPKISSYTIIYNWEQAVILRLALVKKWLKYLDIKINNEIAIILKEILPNYIKEDEKWELSLTDKLIQILKL